MSLPESSNPLLAEHLLPPFSVIKADDVVPAMEQLIQQNLKKIDGLLDNLEQAPTWDSLIAPMEQWDDQLSKAWSPVGHLNSTMNTDALRQAYNACLPMFSEYTTQLGQNQALCEAYKQLQQSAEFPQLKTAQKTAIEHALRDFRLAGVDLDGDKKQRFGEVKKRLSELTAKFGENVLDATQAWEKVITDVSELAGLPDSAMGLLAQFAQQKSIDGYRVTLDFPSYLPIMSYADNRELRREVYTAFTTRASDQGPNAGQFDNTAVINEILRLRSELAQLLGFASYAEYSVATKMAESPEAVLAFLNDLAQRAKPQAEQEFATLQQYAAEELAIATLEPWDITYAAEKLRQQRYAISQEDIRPYFPVDRVLSGMFETVSRLYNLSINERSDIEVYHPDVRYFDVCRDDQVIAGFYLDLFAREHKRGGAWMDDCRVRRQTDQGLQLPIAYLVCNFTPAVGDTPALLNHDELTTLFHEFGHGLHHMLTEVDVAAVSGINGVAWDAVELPSQFMENWCYEPEALAFISGHYQTHEPLPQDLLDKLLAAKNFQSAMMTMRQLEFALFDFRLHHEYRGEGEPATEQVLREVRQQVTVVPVTANNRFQHSFSHIFAGGYAAGYYSYKWAEVLSADAFSKFEEDGIFNQETGRSFYQNILSQGGSRSAEELFEKFRGRKPSVEPLLRHNGIASNSKEVA